MDATETIVCSLVLSRLDYCNIILSGSSKCLIKNCRCSKCSCIILRMPRTEHTTPLLKLPISSRIADKIDSICHTSLTTAYPKYLLQLLTVWLRPARPLRSSSYPNILNVATTRTNSYGQENVHIRDPAIGTESLVKFEGSRTYLSL